MMPLRRERILQEALALPAIERVSIAESLLSSLDRPDPRMEGLWAAEAEDRLAAFDAGRIEILRAGDVFAEFDES